MIATGDYDHQYFILLAANMITNVTIDSKFYLVWVIVSRHHHLNSYCQNWSKTKNDQFKLVLSWPIQLGSEITLIFLLLII